MSILVDGQINHCVSQEPPIASDVPQNDFTRAESKIQPASLDLTVGAIHIPGTDSDKPGGAYTAKINHSLETGQTAVIRTKEVLRMPADLAGIGFPPASLSLRGLLMTNPGHIDPGYRGHLHLTVINMSRKPFPLSVGERIMRVLFFPLDPRPAATYQDRHPQWAGPVITPELLEDLSSDFVDVTTRATKIAEDHVSKAQFRAIAIPVVIAIITVGGSIIGSLWANSNKEAINKLSERLAKVETKLDTTALEQRVLKLENAAKGPPLTNTTPSK